MRRLCGLLSRGVMLVSLEVQPPMIPPSKAVILSVNRNEDPTGFNADDEKLSSNGTIFSFLFDSFFSIIRVLYLLISFHPREWHLSDEFVDVAFDHVTSSSPSTMDL
jgi:hypothetical protein